MVALTVTPREAGSTLQVAVGDTVGVLLPEDPDTGHLWSWWVPDGVQVLSAELDPAPDSGSDSGSEQQGTQRRLLLGVRQPGTYTVAMHSRLPWETDPDQTLTFTLVCT